MYYSNLHYFFLCNIYIDFLLLQVNTYTGILYKRRVILQLKFYIIRFLLNGLSHEIELFFIHTEKETEWKPCILL